MWLFLLQTPKQRTGKRLPTIEEAIKKIFPHADEDISINNDISISCYICIIVTRINRACANPENSLFDGLPYKYMANANGECERQCVVGFSWGVGGVGF
jgi:hypothetical protein